jgi:hypothetical protein|tara:strand:- start:1568 stop:1765 length:198 start_codon:yes stop_codon:yes gene_type:complete
MEPSLFKPSSHTVLTRGLNAMTRACEAQETLIDVIKAELAQSKLRCDELVARGAKLEERHIINQN